MDSTSPAPQHDKIIIFLARYDDFGLYGIVSPLWFLYPFPFLHKYNSFTGPSEMVSPEITCWDFFLLKFDFFGLSDTTIKTVFALQFST